MEPTIDQKSIIVVYGSANLGKTESLRALARLLWNSEKEEDRIFASFAEFPEQGDFRFVLRVNGRVWAIESGGDPNTDLDGRLTQLVEQFSVEVIFCATRNRGATTGAVRALSESDGFEMIWSSPYITEKSQAEANELKGKHLLELARVLSIS